MQRSSCSRFSIYISSMITYFGLSYIMGIMSIIKQPIGTEFGLSSSFLGLLDGALFIGGISGAIFTALYPVEKPIKTLAIFATGLILTMQLQILANWLPSFIKPILLISKLLYGFCLAAQILLQTLINHYFNSQQDQPKVQIWFAFGTFGDFLGIIASSFLLNNLGLSWEITMTCCMILYALSLLYCCLVVDQFQIEHRESDSVLTKIQHIKKQVSQYWAVRVNLLHSIIFSLLGSMYYLALLWFPYFFILLGFKTQAPYISLVYPIASVIGSLSAQPLIIKMQDHLGGLFLSMMALNCLASFAVWFVGDDPQDIPYYFFLIFVLSAANSGFYSYVATTDLRNRAQDNRKFTIINSVNRILLRSFQAINLVLSGVFIDIETHGFIKYYTCLGLICCILTVYRLLFHPQSYQMNNYETNYQRTFQINENDK